MVKYTWWNILKYTWSTQRSKYDHLCSSNPQHKEYPITQLSHWVESVWNKVIIITIVINDHSQQCPSYVAQEAQSSPTNDTQRKLGKGWFLVSQASNWQRETRQLDESSQRRSGRRKLGAAPLSQGCSEARARYFPKEKEKREGEEEEETWRELRKYVVWNLL